MRSAMDKADSAYRLAMAKAAALGGLLATELQKGAPVEALTFTIERTIAANAEVETMRQAVHDEADRARETFAGFLVSTGLGR